MYREPTFSASIVILLGVIFKSSLTLGFDIPCPVYFQAIAFSKGSTEQDGHYFVIGSVHHEAGTFGGFDLGDTPGSGQLKKGHGGGNTIQLGHDVRGESGRQEEILCRHRSPSLLSVLAAVIKGPMVNVRLVI